MSSEINCPKCKLWNQAAIENGYASGMCEECFNKNCVPFRPRGSFDFETGLTRDERFLLNKIRSQSLEKLENNETHIC